MLFILVFSFSPVHAYEIGVFYFPGWLTGSAFWKDLTGLAGSRSPGIPWPDREPLLGFNYPEESVQVAEKEIDWASSNGVTFFAYDWFWYGKNPDTEHAQQAFLKAKNRSKMKFCLLWANHNDVPKTMQEFDDMVTWWIVNYFKEPDYYRINGKPVIFIFSDDRLARQAMGLATTPKALLARAEGKAGAAGYGGIYFIVTTNERPSNALEKRMSGSGYQAYTGWNYVQTRGSRISDYSVMVDGYLEYYAAASKTTKMLPYIASASPGWDDRPWFGDKATIRTDSTPEKFERMLLGAKNFIDKDPAAPKVLMIEAWNEFGEGAYLAPTKKWGLKYLETVKKVFSP